MNGIKYFWSTRHGYPNSKYEKESNEAERRVLEDLKKSGQNAAACAEKEPK